MLVHTLAARRAALRQGPRVDVAAVVADCGRAHQGLASAAALRRAGLSASTVSKALRSGAVQRVRRGVYATEPLPVLPRFIVTDSGPAAAYVAHVRAALLSLGPRATATGRTSAALRGWGLWVEPTRRLEIAVPHGRSRAPTAGGPATQRRSLERELVPVLPGAAALWLATPLQTLVDCCLALPLVEAVTVCDSALRQGAVTLEELVGVVDLLPASPGTARARAAVVHVDPASGSVLESVTRVRMIQARLPAFTSQHVIRDTQGRFVMRVDFCLQEAHLVVEVDGARWHPDGDADRRRDNVLAALGWRVLRFTWADVAREPERVIAEIRAAVTAPRAG